MTISIAHFLSYSFSSRRTFKNCCMRSSLQKVNSFFAFQTKKPSFYLPRINQCKHIWLSVHRHLLLDGFHTILKIQLTFCVIFPSYLYFMVTVCFSLCFCFVFQKFAYITGERQYASFVSSSSNRDERGRKLFKQYNNSSHFGMTFYSILLKTAICSVIFLSVKGEIRTCHNKA